MEHLISQLIALGLSAWDWLGPGLFFLPFVFGAVSTTTIYRTADSFVFDVIATADADTGTGSVAHGMGAIPDVEITPLLQAPAGASLWAATTIDVTNVALSKSTAVGSGNAGAQLRVYVRRRR